MPSGGDEKIAMYLITEKGFHTFIKCNPTLLGYEFAERSWTLWDMTMLPSAIFIYKMICSMKTQCPC